MLTRIDDYLAQIPDDQRAALDRLCAQIEAIVPEATGTISYGLPAFRLRDRYFVGFGATKRYCSFYVGRAPLQAFAEELDRYRTWKGTINFIPDHPIPEDLVEKILRCRLAECETPR